jgi:hypothetical protein
MMSKESAVFYFEILTPNLPGVIEGSHKILGRESRGLDIDSNPSAINQQPQGLRNLAWYFIRQHMEKEGGHAVA